MLGKMCTEAHLLSPVSRAESIEPARPLEVSYNASLARLASLQVISNGDASSYIYGPNGHEAHEMSRGGGRSPLSLY